MLAAMAFHFILFLNCYILPLVHGILRQLAFLVFIVSYLFSFLPFFRVRYIWGPPFRRRSLNTSFPLFLVSTLPTFRSSSFHYSFLPSFHPPQHPLFIPTVALSFLSLYPPFVLFFLPSYSHEFSPPKQSHTPFLPLLFPVHTSMTSYLHVSLPASIVSVSAYVADFTPQKHARLTGVP